MRGGRSFLILLVVALSLGGYIYFVESKRDLTDPAAKKDKVFAVETGKIDELEIHAASGEVTSLKKTGNDWQIVAPIKVTADTSTVSALVSTLETVEKQRSLDDTTSFAQFGLDPARYSVGFKAAGDTTEHRLSVGKKTPTGSDLYARVEGQPKLFLISAYLEDSLNRTTFDLREKTVLKFARDGVDAVTLAAAGSPAVTLARKDGVWRMTAPTDVRADADAVDTLIGQASQAQMKSVVAGDTAPPSPADLKKFGLDTPQLTATFGAGSTRATLAIGAKKDDTTVYVRDLSRPLVFVVDATLLTNLKKMPVDLRVKDVFDFKSFSATGLDMTEGGATFSFAKAKPAESNPAAVAVWKEAKPEAKDVNETAMTDLLNTLSSLRADKFTDRAPASGQDVIVVARSGDAPTATEERVTFRKVGDVEYAIKAGEPGAAIVPAADLDKAVTQLKALTGTK